MQHPAMQDLCERVLGSSVDLLAVILSTGDGVPICRGKPKRKTGNMYDAVHASELVIKSSGSSHLALHRYNIAAITIATVMHHISKVAFEKLDVFASLPVYACPDTAVKPTAVIADKALAAIERRLSHYCSVAADQAQKMGLGTLKVTTTFYANFSLVHIHLPPLMVTCLHDPDSVSYEVLLSLKLTNKLTLTCCTACCCITVSIYSNCGTTLDIIPELTEALEPIRAQVQAVYDKEAAAGNN
eukprot:21477-Heterococcus_DN1.PRE.4